MNNKVKTIESIITHERDFLSGIAFLFLQIETPQKFLGELARREGVSALFHVKRGVGGEYICDMSSTGVYQGKNFTPLMQESKKGIHLVVDPNGPLFFLSRASEDGSGGWITVFSRTYFLQNFIMVHGLLYP